jgi:hypothetical protein
LPYGVKTGIENRSWTQLTKTVDDNSLTEDDYVELTYELPATIERYGIFQVKLVLVSTASTESDMDTRDVPRVRNMRAIVL